MKLTVSIRRLRLAILLLVFLAGSLAVPLRAGSFPWPEGEKLELEIFWPSGVTMGEATLQASNVKDMHFLSASMEVVLPQGRMLYKFTSTTDANLCSREFHQSVERGRKFWEEVTRFDSEAGTASVSRDGKTREIAAGKCARDPLAYLYYYRAQSAAGKHPSQDSLFLTGPLALTITAKGKEQVKINRIARQADRYQIAYPSETGPGTLELWLDGSARQTPVAIRLPLPLATFSAELR